MSFFNALGMLERAPLWDTATKEVVGINAPKILLTRSWDERVDTAVSEIGNTIGFMGTGLLLDKGLEKLFAGAKNKGQDALNWAVAGRSFALFSAIFSIMWAMPFIRNYVTAKRTGATDFTEVIGARKGPAKNRQAVDAAIAEYRNKSLTILGLGLAGVAAATGGALLAINRKAGLGILKNVFNTSWLKNSLTLKDGSIQNFGGIPALLFWGVPAYGGWIQASRDNYERKEQLLKFAAFVGCFFGPQAILKKWFDNKVEKLLPQGVEATYKGLTKAIGEATDGAVKSNLEQLLKHWKTKSVVGLGSSILLLGTVPQLINILWTKKRLSKAQPLPSFQGQTGSPFAQAGNLQRKSFDQWGHQSRTRTNRA